MARNNRTRKPNRLTLRPVADGGVERHASWLELFFDLIFVLAVSQVALELSNDMTIAGFGRFAFIFILPWWAWVGYTFYADRFESERDIVYRLLMLGGMLAVAALAVNVHGAFHGNSIPFALSYVAVRAVLILLYFRSWLRVHMGRELSAAYMTGFSIGATLWLASIFVPEPVRFWFWGAGLLVELFTPLASRRAMNRTPYDASHIPERFGLFTIIVLGETVLSATAGMTTAGWHPTTALAAAGGFAISAGLWWIYFDFIETAGMPRWSSAGQTYLWGHLPVVVGLTVVGVGARHIVNETLVGDLTMPTRWALCGGSALYLVSLAGIQRASTQDYMFWVRIGASVAVVLLAIAAGSLPPLAIEAILLAIVAAQIALETNRIRANGIDSASVHEPDEGMRAERLNISARACSHLDQIQEVTPSADGCEECLALGEPWVEVRMCLTCGHIGCCDTSKHKHAAKHFDATGHPIIETFEPGVKWRWCYVDETFLPASGK